MRQGEVESDAMAAPPADTNCASASATSLADRLGECSVPEPQTTAKFHRRQLNPGVNSEVVPVRIFEPSGGGLRVNQFHS